MRVSFLDPRIADQHSVFPSVPGETEEDRPAIRALRARGLSREDWQAQDGLVIKNLGLVQGRIRKGCRLGNSGHDFDITASILRKTFKGHYSGRKRAAEWI